MEYEGKGGVGYRQKQAILDAGHDGRASSHGGGPHDGVVLAGTADPASHKSWNPHQQLNPSRPILDPLHISVAFSDLVCRVPLQLGTHCRGKRKRAEMEAVMQAQKLKGK